MNLISYVRKYKENTFDEVPFNNIDALIFAELAYVNFGYDVKGEDFIHFRELKIENPKEYFFGSFDAVNNRKLLLLIKDSKRYADVQVGLCEELVDYDTNLQFNSVTFILPGGNFYIAYRGTDLSINGWKEDFLIAYKDDIPGTKPATEYIHKVCKRLNGRFYVGGHSKGGNLAVCAALNMDKMLNIRLLDVFTFDGPGAAKEIQDYDNWELVLPKVKKFLTNNDIIGVVYNKIENAKIVSSTGILLGGHDLFKWQIDLRLCDFKYARDRSFVSKSHEIALTNWLTNMSQEDKKLAVETLIEFLGESKTIYDLIWQARKNLVGGKKKYDGYSLEQQEKTKEIFKQLGKYYLDAYSPKELAKYRKQAAELEKIEMKADD